MIQYARNLELITASNKYERGINSMLYPLTTQRDFVVRLTYEQSFHLLQRILENKYDRWSYEVLNFAVNLDQMELTITDPNYKRNKCAKTRVITMYDFEPTGLDFMEHEEWIRFFADTFKEEYKDAYKKYLQERIKEFCS